MLINVLPPDIILYYIVNSQQIIKTESRSWKGMQLPFYQSLAAALLAIDMLFVSRINMFIFFL